MYLDLMKTLEQNGKNSDDESSTTTSSTNTVTEKRKRRRVAAQLPSEKYMVKINGFVNIWLRLRGGYLKYSLTISLQIVNRKIWLKILQTYG